MSCSCHARDVMREASLAGSDSNDRLSLSWHLHHEYYFEPIQFFKYPDLHTRSLVTRHETKAENKNKQLNPAISGCHRTAHF
jgi:hypothetical protein